MKIIVAQDKQELGRRAASEAAQNIRNTIAARGAANIIVATGASQFETLDSLVNAPDLDWSRVTAFHLDEYVGMPTSHPASFRAYLQDWLVSGRTAIWRSMLHPLILKPKFRFWL